MKKFLLTFYHCNRYEDSVRAAIEISAENATDAKEAFRILFPDIAIWECEDMANVSV